MSSPVDIRADHLEIVQGILREHLPGGVNAWVFGSRADWTTKDSSDLDLALEGKSKLDRKVLGALADAFEDSDLPYTVDIVDINRVSENFRRIVDAERAPLSLGGKQLIVRSNWHKAAPSNSVPFTTLGCVAEIVMGQSPPGNTVSQDGKLPLLNGPTEFGSHHPTPVQYTVDPRKQARGGDILFCVRGSTTGRMNWADQDYAIGRGIAAIRHKKDLTLQPFVRAVVESQLHELLAQATGSTFPNVSAKQLRDIPFPNLDIEQQRSIAHILGTLDDKIELNRRMNATLEGMARALYKSWFVNFEPVRAKMEGRWQRGESLPGMPAEMYDLFPERLVPSELGEVPEGWEVRVLPELLDYKEGPGIRHWQYAKSQEGTRFINIRCIRDGDILLATANRITNEEANGKYAHFHLKERDLVVSTSGTLGRSAVVRASHLPLVLNTSVIRFRPIDGVTLFGYLYGYLNSRIFLDELEILASGSVQKNFGPMHLRQMSMLYPPYNCIQQYEDIAGLFIKQVIIKRTENDALAALRDTLLPRLVSGGVNLEDGLE